MTERRRILRIRTERSIPDRLLLCMAAMAVGLVVGTTMAAVSSTGADLARGRYVQSATDLFDLLAAFVTGHWIGGATAGLIAGIAYQFGGMRSVLAGFFAVMATFMIAVVVQYWKFPHFGLSAAMLGIDRELPVHGVIAVLPTWGIARLLRVV